jgi:hypothetical protein
VEPRSASSPPPTRHPALLLDLMLSALGS